MKTAAHIVIPLLWLAWLAYWIWAARDVKQTTRREDARSRATYNIPVVIGALLIALPKTVVPLDGRFVTQAEGWQMLAMALTALGLGFAVLARLWLGRNWSSAVTVKADHELIRSGPYALVRHPIYTGVLLALIGTALFVGQWRALVGALLMTAAIVRKLSVEERFMADAFGEAYRRYRAEVPMLVPFLK